MRNPKSIFEELVAQAAILGSIGDQAIAARIYREKGEPLPDHLKPGGFMRYLSNEDRETLSKLQSNDIQNYRIDTFMDYAIYRTSNG
jgi:hypothetical protein